MGLSITYVVAGMCVFRCHFVWAHQETSGHVCISLLFANCMNRETNLKLKDPNASDNTQWLDAALSLHSSPESRAGGEAKVRTPSKSGDADNIQ